ncbi:hypothetical protein [Ekhidna sp.]|uniref:hypothetical protein n=1 Tax=Ekhidna sp. TaxID=2608089 RepID=UPI003B5BEDD6
MNAQEFEESKKYKKLLSRKGYQKGYIVTQEKDTLGGLLKFRSNPSGELSSFWFFNQDGKKIYTEPTDVVALKMGDLEYYSNQGSIFLKIYQGEKMDLLKNVTVTRASTFLIEAGFSYLGNRTNSMPLGDMLVDLIPVSPILYLRIRSNEKFVEIQKKDFKSTCKTIFNECPTLVGKISEETYYYHDLEAIIKEYDFCE